MHLRSLSSLDQPALGVVQMENRPDGDTPVGEIVGDSLQRSSPGSVRIIQVTSVDCRGHTPRYYVTGLLGEAVGVLDRIPARGRHLEDRHYLRRQRFWQMVDGFEFTFPALKYGHVDHGAPFAGHPRLFLNSAL